NLGGAIDRYSRSESTHHEDEDEDGPSPWELQPKGIGEEPDAGHGGESETRVYLLDPAQRHEKETRESDAQPEPPLGWRQRVGHRDRERADEGHGEGARQRIAHDGKGEVGNERVRGYERDGREHQGGRRAAAR